MSVSPAGQDRMSEEGRAAVVKTGGIIVACIVGTQWNKFTARRPDCRRDCSQVSCRHSHCRRTAVTNTTLPASTNRSVTTVNSGRADGNTAAHEMINTRMVTNGILQPPVSTSLSLPAEEQCFSRHRWHKSSTMEHSIPRHRRINDVDAGIDGYRRLTIACLHSVAATPARQTR